MHSTFAKVALILATITCTTLLTAQEPPSRDKWVVLRCHPAAEPTLASETRLYPDHAQMEPTNAAPVILRMWTEIPATFWMKVGSVRQENTLEKPLQAFRDEDLTIGLRYEELQRASKCAFADWSRNIYNNENLAEVLLPDVQQGRSIMYVFACNIRSDIAHGRTEEAINKLNSAFGVCHHLQNTPFWVVKLVAAAELDYFVNQIDELIQLPDCPNLYWALQQIPDSLIDTTGVVDFETLTSKQLDSKAIDREAAAIKLEQVRLDQGYRWFCQPPHFAIPKLIKIEEQRKAIKEGEPIWTGPTSLPIYLRIHFIQRRLAMLATVEALRAYAAANDGKLPERLDQITQTPAPNDPFTNRPFRYQAKNQTAILLTSSIDGIDDSKFGLRYRLTLEPTEPAGGDNN